MIGPGLRVVRAGVLVRARVAAADVAALGAATQVHPAGAHGDTMRASLDALPALRVVDGVQVRARVGHERDDSGRGMAARGNDGELDRIAGLLAAGGGVVIAGAAGAGKTRLAAEAAGRAGRTVEWVRATRSAAAVPFGAFAPLLAAADGLAGARRRLAGRGLLLCVDDAQRLDLASAALLHQLVAAGEAGVLATVRAGGGPDAARAVEGRALRVRGARPARARGCGRAGRGGGGRPARRPLARRAMGAQPRQPDVPAGAAARRRRAAGGRRPVALGRRGAAGARAGGAGRRAHDRDRRAGRAPARADRGGRARGGGPCSTTASVSRWRRSSGRSSPCGGFDGRRESLDVAHPLHGDVVRAQLPGSRRAALVTRLADAVDARRAQRATVATAVESFRAAGRPVVWAVRRHRADGCDVDAARAELFADEPFLVASPGADLVDGLEARTSDIVVGLRTPERIYPLKGSGPRRARALAKGRTRSGKAVLYTVSARSDVPRGRPDSPGEPQADRARGRDQAVPDGGLLRESLRRRASRSTSAWVGWLTSRARGTTPCTS